MTSYDLAQIYTEIELYIIKSLKRTFYFHKNEEAKEGFKWEQWQLSKLRSMQKFRQDNIKLLGQHSNAIELAVLEELTSNYKAGYDGVENVVQKAKELYPTITFPDDIKPPPLDKVPSESGLTPISDIITNITPNKVNTPPVEENINFFGMNDKKLKVLIDSVNNDLKKAESSLLRQADDVYRQTIFKTHMYLQSGATTLNQAVDMATKDFLEKGFNCVVYKNGARVNITSYAEMALRTASQRATFMGEGKKRDEWNIHLVVVSAHANTCKLCLPWQGKVLIDDVYSNGSKVDGEYPLLSEAMNLGLHHPNCRHSLATYFPGITKLPEAVDNEKALKNYEAEQKQRHMERQIRRWKKFEVGSVDAENLKKASSKVKEWQSKIKQHLKDNPQLRRDYEREKPGPGISNKDIKDNVKLLKQQTESAKIEEIRAGIKNGEYNLTLNKEAYEKHIEGTKRFDDYIERLKVKGSPHKPSSLLVSYNDAQELINKFAGTGTIIESRGQIKEIIKDNDKIVGIFRDIPSGIEEETSNFIIHYSKSINKGSHIVPIKEDKNV